MKGGRLSTVVSGKRKDRGEKVRGKTRDAQLTAFLSSKCLNLSKSPERSSTEIPNSHNPINLASWNQWAVEKTVSERKGADAEGYRVRRTGGLYNQPIIKLIKGTSTP